MTLNDPEFDFRKSLDTLASMYESSAHTSLEPPLVYNQDQMPLINPGSL